VASGRLARRDIPIGHASVLGTVAVDLKAWDAARKYRLVVGLEGTPIENEWDLWVYPQQLATAAPAGIHVAQQLDQAAEAVLRSGGKVLLLLKPSEVNTPVKIGFSSIFWNTAWTRGQAPHTLGILCNPKHPVFHGFPTEYHTNWQWWELIHDSAAMVLDPLMPELRGLVQPIDTWFENRRLSLLFECRSAGGKLMVASMDLSTDLDRRLVARQLRHSVLQYMAGPDFNPAVEVPAEAIRDIVKK
jgi:hypothetical protein